MPVPPAIKRAGCDQWSAPEYTGAHNSGSRTSHETRIGKQPANIQCPPYLGAITADPNTLNTKHFFMPIAYQPPLDQKGEPHMQGLSARPIANFYESQHYTPHNHRCVRRNPIPPNIRISEHQPYLRAELLSYFERVSFERAGVLTGEYALFVGAEALMCKDGTLLKPNVACENRWANAALDDLYHSAEFVKLGCEIMEGWNSWPVFRNVAILSDAHRTNYYHFSLETLPRLRFFPARYDKVIVPSFYFLKPVIADLFRRTAGNRIVIPQTGVIRVIDPFMAYDNISDESIYWLRVAGNLQVSRGRRRVYIRRSGGKRTAKGGGICEDASFLQFLKDYRFEVLDFGDGEQTVQEQVMKLDGCSVVIAAHGAALTNLVYLDPPLTVIEIFGRYTIRSMYVHISATLGLSYYGIGSVECDEANDIIVNCDEIRDVMTQIG